MKTCGLKSGDTAFVWGLLGQAGRGQRTQGVIDALKAAGVKVEYQEISDAINGDATQGIPVFASFVASHPDIKAVITDHGGLTATIPAYIKAAGKKPGEICGAGFDLSAPIVAGIQDGSIAVVLDQQPFLQGYMPIMQLYLTSKFGFAGMNIDTGAALITKDNIAAVRRPRQGRHPLAGRRTRCDKRDGAVSAPSPSGPLFEVAISNGCKRSRFCK